MRFRSTRDQVRNTDNSDARDIDILHIGIDVPTPFLKLEHFMNHVAGLTSTFFTENKNQLIGVTVLLRAVTETSQDAEPDKTKINHSGEDNRPAAMARLTDE